MKIVAVAAMLTFVSCLSGCSGISTKDSDWTNATNPDAKISIDRPQCQGEAAKAYPMNLIGVSSERHDLFFACMAKRGWSNAAGG